MGLLDSYGDQLPDLMPDVGQNQKPETQVMPEPPKLRSAMRVTQGMQPDQLANDMRMGKTVGLPADFVAADREAVKQKIEEDNAEQALAGAPATRNYLAGNPHTMALTKDDLPNAARLEAILTGEIRPSRTSDPKLAVGLDGTPYLDYSSVPTDQSTGFDWLFKSASQALKAGGYNTAYGLKAYGHMVAGTDPTKDQALMALLDEAKQPPQANGLLEKMWTGGFGAIPMLGSGMLRGATYGAAASGMAGLAAAPLAGGLAATGVGAPAGAAVEGGATAAAGAAGFTFGMFHDIYMQTSGAKYAELIQQGVDPATAQKTAMAVGGVNAALMSARFSPAWLSKLPVIGPALEKAGAQQAIDQVLAQPTIQAAAKDFIVHVAKDTGKNGVLGASMAVVDQLGTAAAMGVQQGLEGQDLLKFIGTQASSPEFWQHAAESGKNMAVDMAGFAIIPGARGLVRDFQAVERAKADRAVFEALDENVGQSKLRERMPDAHADLVEAIREQNGGTMPESVYVDPKALREASGLQGDTFYQMLTQIGVDPADFNRSEALDAPLAIPMKDYASMVAGTDLSAKLRDDMKFDPEGMTAREAQAFEAERDARVTELKQQYEQNKEQHDADFEAAKKEKFDQLMNGAELQGGVKMTRADAEAQLAPMFKMAERAAERWRAMGSDVTAADLLRKVPIQWEEPGMAKGLRQHSADLAGADLNDPAIVADAQKQWAEKGTESPYFKEWFGDSKVVDKKGQPLVVYHGTKSDFEAFDPSVGNNKYYSGATENALFFSDSANTASGYAGQRTDMTGYRAYYADGGNVVPSYLSMKKPLKVSAKGDDWQNILYKGSYYTMPELVALAQGRGNDGIIVSRVLDFRDPGPKGFEADKPQTTYAVFSPEQIKSIHNRGTFDSSDPRILNQEPVQKKDLVAAHNLSEQNLQFADKIGGLPVPSIGITKAATPFDGFGNITLVGHKDMVDPERGVPVFSADAYSARFPEVLWPKVKTKDAQRFMNESRPYFDEFKDGGASNVWNSLVNSPSRDRALEDFTRGGMLGARAMYADQVLGKKVTAPMRDVPHEHLFIDEQLIKEAEGLRYEDVEPGGKDAHTFSEAVKNAIDRSFTQQTEQVGESTFRKNAAERLKEAYLSRFFKDGELTYAGADSVLRDIQRSGQKEVDVAAAEKRLDALVPKEDPAFLKWAADKIGSMFGDPSIKVGGRKVPMSLENLVDAMSTRGVRGKEKTMTFGGGRLSAEASKQFKSIEEIQAERDRVVSPDEHNASVKSADVDLEAYRTSVLAFFTQKDYRGDIDTWAGLDASMKALADAAKKGGGEQSIRSALARNGFKGVNARTVSLAKQALDSVKQAKVDYFEAKPQRGVKLNEFMGAVIPEKTSPEARAILEKNGLRIAEYDGTPEGRAKAVDSLSSDLEQQRPGVLFQPAYHGSPYRFDKFTLDHIGSGEGAQAFGYGLYFASEKSVAQYYRKETSAGKYARKDGTTFDMYKELDSPNVRVSLNVAGGDVDAALEKAKSLSNPLAQHDAQVLEKIKAEGGLKPVESQLYKVEIPEDHQLLLWDKPLSEQPEEVRKALEANVPPSTPLRWRRGHNGSYEYYNDSAGKYSIANYSTGHVRLAVNEVGLSRNIGEYNSVSDAKKAAKEHYTVSPLSGSGKDIYLSVQRVKGSARAASEYLNSIGIKGIKYLDGTSRADGEGSHNYVIFDDKAVQIAKTYYQELMAANRSGTKGSITFDPEQAVIRLFKGNADFSTLLHETAHYFVREMQNMVETGRAPEQVFKDLETMAKFAGDLEGVPAQEKLARAFELYLREGKAPSPEMVKPFQRFQAWLTAIYRNVKAQLGLEEVPTEMRGVFDRMLAADDEVRAAEEATAKKAELEASYLTPAEQKRIADLTARSHAEAVEKRTKRYVSAYLKAIGGKAELEKQARAEIEADPVYKAIDGLTKEGGLPTASVDAIFGAKTRAELGRKFPGLMELKDNTAPKSDLWLRAAAHGFDSADAMIAAIMEKPSKGEAISKLTEQKMANEEARLRASITGEEVPASEDIHNDATLSRLSLEATALERKIASDQQAKQAISSPFNASVAREVARDVLKDEIVSRAGRYDRYAAAERKAGIKADRLIKAGKWQEALAAKQREALNHALVIEAVKARDMVAKQVKTIIREAKAKKIDFEAREQIMALTSTYGIGPRGMKPTKPEELTGIRDYFAKVYGAEDDLAMNPVGFFNDWSLNREQLGSYKNLTVSQMNELHALVSALADAGGSEYTRMASEATMTRQAQLDKMIESVNNSGYQTKQYDRGTTTQKATSAFRDVMASLQRMPDLFRNADGNVDAAPKNAHLMGPNQEFAERLHLGGRKTLEILYSHKDLPEIEAAKVDFAKRFKKQFGERTPEVNGVPVSPVRKVEGMHTWTAESVWCVALNMGNEGNLRTLIQGDGLTMDQLVKLTSVLSERDWKAIQAQWDLLGKYYAETDKVFRKVYNFPMPNRVKPKELTVRTAEGNDLTLPGGYFPIKVDRDINPDIGAKQDQDLIKGDPSNKFAASIAKGHTKERLGTSRPVSLSYEVAHRAMLDQARFIALAPIIKDAQAIYTSPEYRRAMIDAFGKEAYDGILPWLKNIASPTIEGKDHFDNALSKLRHLSTLYILGLNLKSATKQYLGLAGTANKLGVKWTASGLTEMAKWGGMGKDFVDEKSAFMRNREEGLNPELAEINAKARGNEFRLFGIKTGLPKKKVVDAVMVLTRLTDRHVTYSTWLGAYKKGLQELGLADSEAVDFADRIVRRTQMSGSAVDTTGWQRSEGAKRLLTMFMSEAIPKSSRMRSDFTAFKNGNMTAAQYGRSLFYETIAPAVGYTALMGLMGGEDKKSWFKDLFWQLYSETFGLFPLLGGVQSAVEFNKPVAGTPSLEALDIFTNVVKAGIKLHDDHSSEGKARMYKALVDATAYMHGVGNLRRIYETAAEGWKDIDHNKTVNPFRLFIRKPKDQ